MKTFLIALMIGFLTYGLGTAFAAESLHSIELQKPLQGLISFIFGLVGGLSSLVLAMFVGPNKKLGIDANMAATIEVMLQGAIRIAEQKARAAAQNIDDPQVKSELLANAANFVLNQTPKLAAFAGVNAQNIQALILQRLADTKGTLDVGRAA